MTDITAGILAAMGVTAALHVREKTGLGQMVDTSLFKVGITFTYWHSAIESEVEALAKSGAVDLDTSAEHS